ncbi:MAG: hypothetical protein WCL07_00820 [bacterium]
MPTNKKNILFAVLYFVIVYIVGKLAFSYIAPFGKALTYKYTQDLPTTDSFISLDRSANKLTMQGTIIKTKSTRFSLPIPKNLSNIKVHMAYKSGQSEIKLGVRGDESSPFVYRSLYFAPLVGISWDKVEENGLMLYQKNRQFTKIGDMLKNLSQDKKLGTYMVDPATIIQAIYPKEAKPVATIITTPIRGGATIQILHTGGDLRIKLNKQDINMYEGEDILHLTLTLNGTKVKEATIGDDGIKDKSSSKTAPQQGEITVTAAKPGVYQLELAYDSQGADSYVSRIEINQKRVIFAGGFLAYGGVATTVYADSPKLTANTSWESSVQDLRLDDKADLPVKEIKTKYEFDLNKLSPGKKQGELYKIAVPKGNMSLSTTGYLSFSQESYFDPSTISRSQALNSFETPTSITENFDYILTTLPPTTKDGDWTVSDLLLSSSDYQLKGDKIFFELAIPELDKHGGTLEISALDLTLISK